ncbi:glycerol kinase [Aquibacillus halophilus]|uniref:Glycerol kinase n=1 Tax=Aquibacillus halophilus TaxID=930132 RepID=A0A6A8D737_9BACI|nr:glycerol kinase [Aquibacillus halophilus]MRH41573.1 glycerol kinase [Aquibacillus halophilus]
MSTSNKVKYISTTALSKELKMNVKEVFQIFLANGLINRVEENWVLTDNGRKIGGTIKKHPRIGEYIAWDETIKNNNMFNKTNETLINATALSNHFGVSKFKMNPILSELGFVQKNVKGWTVTKLGLSIGGKQLEYDRTGVPYVNWPEGILQNKRLVETMNELQGNGPEENLESDQSSSLGFREKFVAKHRSADGHYVRSRAEMLIDNWLYMSEIVHAYERKLPIEEDVYTDFYLPVGKVYIEYWGLEDEPKYAARKQEKLRIYEKYGFNLIELQDADIQNLDDILPKKLLKFGIQAY